MTRNRPDVVAFDVLETLLDLTPVQSALEELGRPGHLLPTVFARTLQTGFAGLAVGTWAPFRSTFDAALAQLTDLTADERELVADAFGEMSPHADVEPALRRLTEAGVRAVTLSHGTPGLAETALQRGGLNALVERSMSSESIEVWKPAQAVYLWAAGSCHVAPAQMALVAAHGWDVHGAQRAGLTGAWFPRAERSYPSVFDQPHVTADGLVEAVDALLALPSR